MVKFKISREMHVATGLNKSKKVQNLIAGNTVLVRTANDKLEERIVKSKTLCQDKVGMVLISTDSSSEVEDKRCVSYGRYRSTPESFVYSHNPSRIETDMGSLEVTQIIPYDDTSHFDICVLASPEEQLLISEYENAPFAFIKITKDE